MADTRALAKSSGIFLNISCYILARFNNGILNFMNEDFEQISLKPGFMKHNGGLLFKTTSEDKYQFKTTIKENHLNAAGITHGGFIAALVDAGAGTAAHRAADNNPCVTISLELKFISPVKLGQELVGFAQIQKKTKSMIFLTCELKTENKIVATASGVWKKVKLSGSGPGG
tara:strand:+ start:2079 stop:2594 length:516 start_codon:yes stop_codon:yes gene_type:complete